MKENIKRNQDEREMKRNIKRYQEERGAKWNDTIITGDKERISRRREIVLKDASTRTGRIW